MADPDRDTAAANRLWGFLLIEELVRCGVVFFCISPGSRSTPLTAAAARHPGARTGIFFDERGAAFHALGYARATGRPAALLCTSGTAAANYFPAVIEAAMDAIPLIILSADRPPELRETGANQTIRQTGLFGDYLRWRFELPCPDPAIPTEMVLTTVDQAVYRAQRAPAGPVHLNCMFREPFDGAPPDADSGELPAGWQKGNTPYTTYHFPVGAPLEASLVQVGDRLRRSRRGILSVGRLEGPDAVAAARRLAATLGWPLFADITSGLRLDASLENAIPYFDQLLLSDEVVLPAPDTVLHLGGQMVSKRWQQFLSRQAPEEYVVVAPHPFRQDPGHRVTLRMECAVDGFVAALLPHISATTTAADWLTRLRRASQRAGEIMEEVTGDASARVDEIAVARLVSRHLAPGQVLFLASSMPVRDMDMYGTPRSDLPAGAFIRVGANRGASGIDGTISTACGFVQGCNAPGVLLIGDLAALHDLNALAAVRGLPHPLIIVILNNRGGGIFHFLPVAAQTEIFETFFATPHQFNFANAAAQFGLDYACPETSGQFSEVFRQWQQKGVSGVIEVLSDREDNLQRHRQLQQKIITAMAQIGGKT